MAKANEFWAALQDDLRQVIRSLREGWRRGAVEFRNWLRRARRARIDYVVIPISGPLAERAPRPRNFIQRQLPLPPEPLSLEVLNARLRAISEADNVRGVVFVLQEFTAPGIATLQSLRRAIERLRDAGKEAVVFTPYMNLAHYYVACAADRVVVPPGSNFDVVGLRAEAVFLKDALSRIGIAFDVLQISPYKTAGNLVGESEMTPEQREQLEWILDDNFDMITAGIADGRGLSQQEVRRLIDNAPFPAADALAASLVDDVAYEDQLPRLLVADENVASGESTKQGTDNMDDGNEATVEPSVAKLVPWGEARRMLLEKPRHFHNRYIGVVSLEGMIINGSSRRPPIELPIPLIGGAMAGDETISRLLRQAERQDRMAALIFHVDSRGGSALASDLIWRQVERLASKKPVVVYMGDVAASGGYYVSAAAHRIVCQPGTLTGSIGVIVARANTDELYDQLRIGRTSLQRGEHADIYSDSGSLSGEKRETLWRNVEHLYAQFKDVVREGRELSEAELEPVAGGRVWTGRQALQRRLIDEHGDFLDAVDQAKALAELPLNGDDDVRVVNLFAGGGNYVPPEPYAAAQEILGLFFAHPYSTRLNGKPLVLMPFSITISG